MDIHTHTALAAIFIRGLFEAYMRNTDNTDLLTLIRSYIDVQVSPFRLHLFLLSNANLIIYSTMPC